MPRQIKTDGSILYLPPKRYTLEELQALVASGDPGPSWIEHVYARQGSHLIIHEEGKLRRLPVNIPATMLAGLPNDVIVGDVVFFTAEEWNMQEAAEEDASDA